MYVGTISQKRAHEKQWIYRFADEWVAYAKQAQQRCRLPFIDAAGSEPYTGFIPVYEIHLA